ncbi:MAG TPA: hypothetical protein PKZ36_02590 [Candidatus Paceibacterota bacterium]|nr:hypothetical protein [Candidatus Paceibacterota bacterium]HPT18266.1 hypothetical protein [Candidatus Paceibacterota bacterium]
MINRKKLLNRIILFILFIFVLNFLAMKFYWYSSIWWFDMPMHLLGGFWIGITLIWFLSLKNLSLKNVIIVILGVLLVGIGWEIFEISVDKIVTGNVFNVLDTMSDICFDLSGGFLSMFYFLKRIMVK